MTIFDTQALQLQYTLEKEVHDIRLKLLKIRPVLLSRRAMTHKALENYIKMTQTALGAPEQYPINHTALIPN